MRVVSVVAFAAVLAIGAGKSSAQLPALNGAIVFERDAGGSSDLYVVQGSGDPRALVVSDDEEFDPSVSVKGGRLAFARASDAGSDLRVLISGRESALTRDPAIDAHPAWSPDERSVVYASDSGNGFELKVVQVGNPASARLLVSRTGDDITPAWSRDSRRITFANNGSGTFDLFLRDSGKVTRLSRTPDDDISPSWSPDGQRIAFTRVDRRGNAEIYVLTVVTRALVRLTRDAADDSDPAWSPDGAQIAFVSDRGGTPAIWRVSARGGEPTQVSTGPEAVDLGPTWGRTAPSPPRRVLSGELQGVTCPDPPHKYAGTDAGDMLDGTAFQDVICGRGGADVIHGLGERDRLSGGDAGDRVYGDDGDDFIVSGGPGADYVYGGSGNDALISGGDSADRHYGGSGSDKLFNRDAYRDYVDCGLGFDRRQVDSSPTDTVIACEAYIA